MLTRNRYTCCQLSWRLAVLISLSLSNLQNANSFACSSKLSRFFLGTNARSAYLASVSVMDPQRRPCCRNTQLKSKKDDYDDRRSKQKKAVGVYSRPSAAIERGSGFYVPGLEGSRVRSLFGILVSALCYLNHSSAGSQQLPTELPGSQFVSEFITYSFGLLLILQGLVEFGKETLTETPLGPTESLQELSSSSSLSLTQRSSSMLRNQSVESLQWIAASLISLTPATHVLLIEMIGDDQNGRQYSSTTATTTDSSVLFQLGDFSSEQEEGQQERRKMFIEAAITAAFQSKGGRISVPTTHPAAQLIPEPFRRCVLLQRLDSTSKRSSLPSRRRCLVIGSDSLLPAFTKNDLLWIGSLATYAQLELELT
jgi:hypothetical protein